MTESITRYDIKTDGIVPVTQKDWDDLERFLSTCGTANRPEAPAKAKPETFNFRLAAYVNPMRNDGLFVAEEKETQPVKSPMGGFYYHPTPETPWKFWQQTHPDFAREVVRRWNACHELGI